MTHAERAVLEPAVRSGVTLAWAPHEDSRFVRLLAHPCPLLTAEGACSVYGVRPYNCRRFGCFRDDCAEPFNLVSVEAVIRGSRSKRRQYAAMQVRAQRWALQHGWEASS
jgi:Fe-S-cluster containining protein